MPKLYYSTVPYIKFYIQKTYFKDVHFVWCSEMFDNRQGQPHSPHTLVPPSSNPSEIYRELKDAVTRPDRHSAKITAQRASLTKITLDKHSRGEIDDGERDEIIFMLNNCDQSFWRPVIYVIPNQFSTGRVKPVPIGSRASFGPEYTIEDLVSDDFDMIEV